MISNGAHIVGVIGGAVSGSEAANRLANRGIIVIVFDMKSRPYGKIEDGLPIWHKKLRGKYIEKINKNLSHPNIHFVPNVRIGSEVNFNDLLNKWEFSSILLANGAWKDRILNVNNADDYVDKGLIYQNSLVANFNRSFSKDFIQDRHEWPDDIIVIGGGLASLDVVKIIMLKTVHQALLKRNIDIDIFTLEHETIRNVLKDHGISMQDLGLNGCTLFYRKRAQDMPLAAIPPEADKIRRDTIYRTRLKILTNFKEKYLFNIKDSHIPSDVITKNGCLVGLKFKTTQFVDGKLKIQDSSEYSVNSPLVVSSIGSVPEPINGIPMNGELYDIKDLKSGQLRDIDNVFALGNVVTGKGNILASIAHGKKISDYVMDYYLAWKEDDYNDLLSKGAEDATKKSEYISQFLSTKNLKSPQQIESILMKIKEIRPNTRIA